MSRTPGLLSLGFLVGSIAALALPVPCQSKHPSEVENDLWYGVLETPDREFRFVIELNPAQTPTSGTLKSLDEGNRLFQLNGVTSNAGTLKFSLPTTNATYSGELDETGTHCKGTWIQRGSKLPLSIAKVKTVPQPDIKVVLTGTLNAIVQKLDVSFVELDSGKVYFNSISQKAGGFVTLKEVSPDGELTLRVPAVKGTFRGRYQDDGKTRLKGKWSQGLVSLDLELTAQTTLTENLNQPEVKVARPQTPHSPFPYQSEQVKVEVPDCGVTLAGTLTLPEDEIKAAMILVSGSGPQDRDETIFGHKPFWVIADHFARNGIATLRYDDRGVAKSTGTFKTATSYDLADDAEAAFNYLAGRVEFQNSLLGICGHSEGGLLAPLIAARNPKVGFLILLAAPGVNGEEIILSQGPLLMRAQGGSAAEIRKQQTIQKIVLTLIRDRQEDNGDLLEQRLRDSLGDDLENLAELTQGVKAGLKQTTTPWLREFLVLDPKTALSKVKVPVLAINGTKDLQVDPVLNLPVIRDTLQKHGNSKVEINVYPGLNHMFQRCQTGLPAEYGTIEETFNSVPLQRMTSWVLSHSGEASPLP